VSRSRTIRRAVKQKLGTNTQPCVVCSKPIPRRQKAAYYTDRATGAIFGAHLKCITGKQGAKDYLACLKKAMTWGQWFRFRMVQARGGFRRHLTVAAKRWPGWWKKAV